MLTIGWFSTGRDKAARQLLEVVYQKIQQSYIKGKILFVFSNREPHEEKESDLFFNLVKSYGIPLVCLSSWKFKDLSGLTNNSDETKLRSWRLDYDRLVMKQLNGFHPDLCVLAGYMLIVGDEMCRRYKMINLHPAVPGGPKGTWQEVIWQLIDRQATESGVMMHLVTPELDSGPVITYCTYPIRGKPFDKYWRQLTGESVSQIKRNESENNALFRLIRSHGLTREFPLIVSTLKAFADGEIRIEDGKLFDKTGKSISGYNLTSEVNEALK